MSEKKLSDYSLSIVIPMYHEEESVAPLLARVHEGLAAYLGPWELICVDDGSNDATVEKLLEGAGQYGSHVRVIRLQRNYGQTAAMQAGIDAARGDLIATLDGDLQNDPGDIPRMLEELLDRDLDLLQGWRRKRHDEPVRKFFSRQANRLIAKATGVNLHDYGCSLKVYRASIIKQVRLFGEMHRFIPVWVAGVTSPRRIGETVVSHKPREFGSSKYGLSRTFRVIQDLLSVFFFLNFRARPGHFFGSIGLLFGAIGGLMLTYLTLIKVFFGEDIGNRPLLFLGVLLIVVSIQFMTTGVLAELMARTYFESNQGRAYILAKDIPDSSGAGWHKPGTAS
ncbi:MAG: family 2 glycosyl transferase [Gammaproteobacteria bacterium RIFOXYD12_FULL_61_37]|nr:MAG: family 2 glycosyl transferase [Gammaproteobacteria bacterium RIFOXYD12_FULL_61_37]